MWPMKRMIQTAESKILEKLRKNSELCPKGFDFIISAERLPWLEEVVSEVGAAYKEIADEIVWANEGLTGRPITLTEFMLAYMSHRQANTVLGIDTNPAYWRIGADLGDLVVEDFETNNIIPAVCVSIAPSKNALKDREARR